MTRVSRTWASLRLAIARPLARLAYLIAPKNAEGERTAHVSPARKADVANYSIHRWVGKTYWLSYSGTEAVDRQKGIRARACQC
jgi:hypothetical protein